MIEPATVTSILKPTDSGQFGNTHAVGQPLIFVFPAISLIGFVIVHGQMHDGRDSAPPVLTGFLLLLLVFLSAGVDKSRSRTAARAVPYAWLIVGFVTAMSATPALVAYIFKSESPSRAITEDYGRPAASLWLLSTFLSFMLLVSRLFRGNSRGLLGLNLREVVRRRILLGYGVGVSVGLLTLLVRGPSIDERAALPALLQPFEQLVTSFTLLPYMAIAVFAMSANATDRKSALLLAAPLSVIGMANGFFKPTLWAVLVFSISRAIGHRLHGRHTMTWRTWLTGGIAAFICVLFVVPIVQTTRQASQDAGFFAELKYGYSETWGTGFSTGWEVFADKATSRQAGVFVGVTRVLDRVPEKIPHKGRTELAETPSALVPRLFWPGKPIVSNGVEVSVLFFDEPVTTRSSSSILVVGDAYWYAGLFGVLTVATFGGMLVGFLETRLTTNAAAILGISLLPPLLDIETNLAQWLAGVVFAVLTGSVFIYWASRPTGASVPALT